MIDGQGDDDDDDVAPEEKRLADEVKAEAKGGAGGPQSKLVQDILGRQAEQEAARKTGVPEAAVDETKGEDASGGGIRISRLRKTSDKGKSAPGTTPGTFNDGDMDRLRGAIQVLVQHTGPLGTCMDYVQEDISLMTAELQRWEEECRRYEGEVEGEKRKSREVLQPLQVELAELEEQLLEQQARISSTKAAIARNDDRIQQILKIVATS
jgi:TRAF3-interacting protein 1